MAQKSLIFYERFIFILLRREIEIFNEKICEKYESSGQNCGHYIYKKHPLLFCKGCVYFNYLLQIELGKIIVSKSYTCGQSEK